MPKFSKVFLRDKIALNHGIHCSSFSYQLCQQRRVITSSSSLINHPLAFRSSPPQ